MKQAILFTTLGLGLATLIIWAGGWLNPQEEFSISGFYSTEYTFFNATTTTATSTNTDTGTYLNIANAEKVTFEFGRGDTTGQGNTGTSTFNVQVTPDGTNWFDYANLVSATSSETTAYNRFATEAATTTDFFSMDLINDMWEGVRCIVNETTDGEHTCKAQIMYK